MGAQDVPGHLLERPSSGHLGKGPRPRLAVVREDVEIVLVLGKTVDDPRELPDGIIDMPEGAQSRAVTGAEGMGEHVVVEEVDVHGGDAAVEIGRDTEGEELPHPDGKHDLEAE